jgi:hypothetical protein
MSIFPGDELLPTAPERNEFQWSLNALNFSTTFTLSILGKRDWESPELVGSSFAF